MIDEKKLIKDLEETVRVSVKAGDCTARKLLGLFMVVITSQPKVGEWVPCGERLPKVKGHYLVTISDSDGERVDTHSFDPAYPRDREIWRFGKITAWKPKPEPWKGETE